MDVHSEVLGLCVPWEEVSWQLQNCRLPLSGGAGILALRQERSDCLVDRHGEKCWASVPFENACLLVPCTE
jgi:hypothetical protein